MSSPQKRKRQPAAKVMARPPGPAPPLHFGVVQQATAAAMAPAAAGYRAPMYFGGGGGGGGVAQAPMIAAAAAAAAPPPKSAYLRKLEETKRLTGPQMPVHPGATATKEQLQKYQDDLSEFYDQREMDRQSEAIQLSTEEDSEAARKRKIQAQASLTVSGHLARSGCFARGVLFTQTPFVALVRWLDARTAAADAAGAQEFTVCISREATWLPWGVLLRSAPDLTSPHCVVAGCTKAVCVDPATHPLAHLPLHSPLFAPSPLSDPAAHSSVDAALAFALAESAAAACGVAAAPPPPTRAPPHLLPGDLLIGVGGLDLSHCAFDYIGPNISDAPAAASAPPAAGAPPVGADWKPRSAAFSAAYLALKLPVTRLLLRIRRPAPAPASGGGATESSAAAGSGAASLARSPAGGGGGVGAGLSGGTSAAAAGGPSVATSLECARPNWSFFCAEAEARRCVVRLMLLESKASKWYAAATRQYMEETLSPRVFECLAAAETPREELISAWRQLAAAVPDLVAGAAPPALPAAAAAAPAPRPPPPYVHWLNPDSPIALRATALITSLTAFADEFENGISSQPSRQGALPDILAGYRPPPPPQDDDDDEIEVVVVPTSGRRGASSAIEL